MSSLKRPASLLLLGLAASLAGGGVFSDLPLCEFEEPEPSYRSDRPGFHIALPSRRSCLGADGANSVLEEGECGGEEGQLWVYTERSKQLQLASDVRICLDVFGPHAGNQLGAYFCHGGSGLPSLPLLYTSLFSLSHHNLRQFLHVPLHNESHAHASWTSLLSFLVVQLSPSLAMASFAPTLSNAGCRSHTVSPTLHPASSQWLFRGASS